MRIILGIETRYRNGVPKGKRTKHIVVVCVAASKNVSLRSVYYSTLFGKMQVFFEKISQKIFSIVSWEFQERKKILQKYLKNENRSAIMTMIRMEKAIKGGINGNIAESQKKCIDRA